MQIKRLKSLQESSNKLKQEKWVDEKTRRIKEQTVRGLEPEIQRLMARHTAELANLESERERQLAAQERCYYSLISVSEHGEQPSKNFQSRLLILTETRFYLFDNHY